MISIDLDEFDSNDNSAFQADKQAIVQETIEKEDKPVLVKRKAPEVSLLSDKERDIVRNQYLDRKRPRKAKKPVKRGFKSQFKFEWDDEEDTLGGEERAIDGSVMFGKSRLGGTKGLDKEEDSVSRMEMPLDRMKKRDWLILREEFEISIKKGVCPNPLRDWEEAEIPRRLRSILREAGFSKPTPVQMQAVPAALQCRDFVALAPTGSGKTAAYLVPVAALLAKQLKQTEEGPLALILVPTREVAMQVSNHFEKFAEGLNLRHVLLVGGVFI